MRYKSNFIVFRNVCTLSSPWSAVRFIHRIQQNKLVSALAASLAQSRALTILTDCCTFKLQQTAQLNVDTAGWASCSESKPNWVLQAALRAKEAGSTRFCMGAAWRGPTQVSCMCEAMHVALLPHTWLSYDYTSGAQVITASLSGLPSASWHVA